MITIIFEDSDVLTTNAPVKADFKADVSLKKAQHLAPLEVYADGHEHQLITGYFTYLPYGHGQTVWAGEMAKFIVANISNL